MKSIKISGVLLYLFGLVLVLLLYFNYVFIPLNGKISDLNELHYQNIEQVNLYKNNLANINNLKNSISNKEQKLKIERNNLEIKGNYIAEDVGKMSNLLGVPIKLVSVDTGNKTDNSSNDGKQLLSADIQLNFICTNDDLSKIVNYFENQSKGIYSINNIRFLTDNNKLNTNLNLTLYYFAAEDAKK